MAYVVDWSPDYTRSAPSGNIIQSRILTFSGYVNHSRRIFYAFNLVDGSLISVKNVTEIAISDSHGWAVVQEAPLYSSAAEDGNAVVIANGFELGSFKRDSLAGVKWVDGKLEIKLLAQPEKNESKKTPKKGTG